MESKRKQNGKGYGADLTLWPTLLKKLLALFGGNMPMKRRCTALASAVAILSALTLALWSSILVAENTPADEVSSINPIVHNCNPALPRTDLANNPGEATPALLTRDLPCDRVFQPKGPFDLPGLQHDFDFYSWLTFIALNSPEGVGAIGEGDARTEWETYRQLPDVMRPKGVPPTDWDSKNNALFPDACQALKGDGKKIVIHLGEEETFSQPFNTGPLIDQSGHYAMFIIMMNKPMFEYIQKNKLYSVEGQRNFKAGAEAIRGSLRKDKDPNPPIEPGLDPVSSKDAIINFPNGANVLDKDGKSTTEGTVGSIMLKGSWKVLDEERGDDPKRFHVVRALVYTKTSADGRQAAKCVERKLGLVGFHIVHKTVNAHQWIWSTFEHIDNVPSGEDIASGNLRFKYSFFDILCKSCRVNHTPEKPWSPEAQKSSDGMTFRNGYKSQITRVVPVTPDVQRMNAAFQGELAKKKSVFANYMLVSTQWPTLRPCNQFANTRNMADPTCAPAPTFLANTTLETYSQGITPISSSSCIACHGNATGQAIPASPSDFTFILEKAKKERP